jgi:hypothetical protein
MMSEEAKSGGGRGPTGVGEQGCRGDLFSPPLPCTPAPLRFALSAAALALAALWLYRRALTFAFFNDDPTGHFAWMEGQPIWRFFASSAEYGYYRPVVFTTLRLFETLFGNNVFPHNLTADHALLVLLHGANAALVWTLARRLSHSEAFAWVAALVFAFVPFSYEAVAYVASLTHPLVVFWVLVALLLYDRGWSGGAGEQRRRGPDESRGAGEQRRSSDLDSARWSLLGSGLAMVLGLLTHENGLFIFPALVGLDWVTRPHDTTRARARRLWPFAVPPLLFVALWLVIPKNSEQGLNSLVDIGRNVVPFLQTLVYPLLPLARLDAGDVWPLVLLAAGVVVLFGLLARQAGALRLWVFALGWFGLAALPALLFLDPAYVYGSPRLSYLPAVGASLLWAIPVLWLFDLGNRVWRTGVRSEKPGFYGRVILTVLYTTTIILPPLPFIRCQLDFYAETSRFARDMARAAAAAPDGRDVVFVNAPFFFSSTIDRPDGCPSAYPWTPVGGILIPPYAAARDFVRFNGGPDRPVEGVTFPGYGPGWRTFGPEIDGETLRSHAADDAVFVFDLLSGSFADLSDAWQPGLGAVEAPLASFGGALALMDARLQEDGETLIARLDWRVVTAPEAPLAAFIHVYDAAGALVAQSDGPPGQGLVPQALWWPGDGLGDERRIDLSSLPPGAYTVVVGVYNMIDSARLAVESGGESLPDDVYQIGVVER